MATFREKVEQALEDFKNFLIWESKQDWQEDYDREGNRNNSQNISLDAIIAACLEVVGEDEKPYTSHANKQMLEMANEQIRYENHLRKKLRAAFTSTTDTNNPVDN